MNSSVEDTTPNTNNNSLPSDPHQRPNDRQKAFPLTYRDQEKVNSSGKYDLFRDFKSVMVVVAHPDDAECCAGGTVYPPSFLPLESLCTIPFQFEFRLEKG